MTLNQKNSKSVQQEDSFRIQDLPYLCLAKWKWFVLSLVIALGAATVYILRTPPVYTGSASVLLKMDGKNSSLTSDTDFSKFGMFRYGTNIQNEMISFQSPSLMAETVRRLNLDWDYSLPGRFHRDVAYGSNLPVTVSADALSDGETASFTLNVRPDSALILTDFVRGGKKIDIKEVRGRLGDPFPTPVGPVVVRPAAGYRAGNEYVVYVSKGNFYAAVGSYSSRLGVVLTEEKSSIIDLSFKDKSLQRAEDVLNTLITVYSEAWVKDRNQIAISTSMFINERLSLIERELGNVDEDISSYKSEHLLPDVQAVSSMYMSQSSEISSQLLALNNQLHMTRYIREYIAADSNRNQLLPANSGIESASIETQIGEYNRILLQRNNLVANSSVENPIVLDMDRTLLSMREAMIQSVDNLIVTLETQISSLRKTEATATSRLAASPAQAKYLLSVERQQKVKESLYLYLLQKREENELSQAFTAYNTRVLTPPHGSGSTASTNSYILLIALAIGLLLPLVVIFLGENFNTKIRGKKDLENLSVPFAGEIPLCLGNRKKRFWGKPKEVKSIVVKPGSRDLVNEAFRVLRTNLEFMTGSEKDSNVLLVTSFNPGSGKSFLTMNIAMSLAIKGKKVLVIDGDLRHGSASSYVGSPTVGLSDYLASRTTDQIETLIVRGSEGENFDLLPVGTIPPNPTELLFDDRLADVISTCRRLYDFVLIDCPPVEIVADTQIISKLVDRTVFVVRAGLLERSMLSELEKIYSEKRFKNMCVILNGTESRGGRYGYKYGYRYGYHYGYSYGYGYGYGSSSSSKKSGRRGGGITGRV